MIVVGSRERGAFRSGLLSSVSSGLIHHAHCPVAVIHDEDASTPHPVRAPVLVGIDGSPVSEPATAIAFDEASRRGVDLVALHAWSDVGAIELPGFDWATLKAEQDNILAERLARWQQRYPDVTVNPVVVCDQPARQLVEHSATAQLVVGSRGRGGFAGMLLGSVSTAVAHAARIPVIVARHKKQSSWHRVSRRGFDARHHAMHSPHLAASLSPSHPATACRHHFRDDAR